jgi:hypothetical protein
MSKFQIRVGQIWGDLDHRASDHRLYRIKRIGEDGVECERLNTGKVTIIKTQRLKPGSKDYFLALDEEVMAEVWKQLAEARNREAANPPANRPRHLAGGITPEQAGATLKPETQTLSNNIQSNNDMQEPTANEAPSPAAGPIVQPDAKQDPRPSSGATTPARIKGSRQANARTLEAAVDEVRRHQQAERAANQTKGAQQTPGNAGEPKEA